MTQTFSNCYLRLGKYIKYVVIVDIVFTVNQSIKNLINFCPYYKTSSAGHWENVGQMYDNMLVKHGHSKLPPLGNE